MEMLLEKAKQIRLVIFDVDGVLTNGTLIYGPNGTESKKFHAHDGMGMRLLLKSGIEIGIITARNQGDIVTKRMQDLEVKHVYQGCTDKVLAYDELKKKLNIEDHQIAYVGDDLPDLPLLRRVGLSVTVPNAPLVMRQYAMMMTKAKGGRGAAREVCELIMTAQGTYEKTINAYLER